MKTREELIDELIDLAFAEDIGDGDATTLTSSLYLLLQVDSST